MLTREEILSKKDLKKEEVEVPDWGGSVLVSEMTGLDRDEFDRSLFDDKKQINLKGSKFRLIVMTVVDESGNRVFSNDDIEQISRLGSSALDKIALTAQRLNGMAAESIEDVKGNSEAAQSGDSTSD